MDGLSSRSNSGTVHVRLSSLLFPTRPPSRLSLAHGSHASAKVSKAAQSPSFTLGFFSGGSRQELADELQGRDSTKCVLVGECK